MVNRFLFVLFIVVSCLSCTRKIYSIRSEATPRLISYHPVPLKEDELHDIEVRKPSKVALSKIDERYLTPKRELKEISNFTANEKIHASISTSFDPFNGGSSLEIDLDRLKKIFRYPCRGARISNYGMRSGRFHSGVDLKVELGEKVYSALPGVVRVSRSYGAYGNIVVVRHLVGLETVYAHNSKNFVRVGDIINAGDVIALGGRSGNATTTHIHFEVRAKGKVINPNLFLDTNNRTLQSGMLSLVYRNSQVVASLRSSGKTSIKSDKKIVKEQKSTQNRKADSPKTKIHTIKRGDSLYAISKRYGITLDKLCKINGIKKSSTIHPGQKLKVK